MTADQRWSKDKPSKEGWYWYRRRFMGGTLGPLCLQVDGEQVAVCGEWTALAEFDGEWCGPLAPPHD